MVHQLADATVLLLQPETGDDIQWEKAGLLEVADVIAIHKADLPQAEQALKASADLSPWRSPRRLSYDEFKFKTGAREQYDREGNFYDHKTCSKPSVPEVATHTLAASRQPRVQVTSHRVERRCKTVEDCRQNGDT